MGRAGEWGGRGEGEGRGVGWAGGRVAGQGGAPELVRIVRIWWGQLELGVSDAVDSWYNTGQLKGNPVPLPTFFS